jgi:hypothetical protein
VGTVAGIAVLVCYVALAGVLVTHAGTASDINAAGNAFSTSLKAATSA